MLKEQKYINIKKNFQVFIVNRWIASTIQISIKIIKLKLYIHIPIKIISFIIFAKYFSTIVYT